MFRFSGSLTTLCAFAIWGAGPAHATERLHPIDFPTTQATLNGYAELDDDVYSGDMTLSMEYAPISRVSLYADASYRFLSYSYEYSTEGYIHNYCNLHVNGFNETYIGAKAILWRTHGLDISWRFPPGEGSQLNRFHRLKVEPFSVWQVSRHLALGTALRYSTFLQSANFEPGDELGLRATLAWKFGWNDERQTGWKFTHMWLYQARIQTSENHNLSRPYSEMKDKYRGLKIDYEIDRYFNILGAHLGFGLNYQIHKGTLFGFETGHLIGFNIKLQ